mmetsp:Transcript_28193/g.89843  ORF Transcript_28193/g.89843 Transcript_28193/m.89843 type:complete len:216 (+) Transcript_28193:332-979(+)
MGLKDGEKAEHVGLGRRAAAHKRQRALMHQPGGQAHGRRMRSRQQHQPASLEHPEYRRQVERIAGRDAQQRVERTGVQAQIILVHRAQHLRLGPVQLRVAVAGGSMLRGRRRVADYLVRLKPERGGDLLGEAGGGAAADDPNFAAFAQPRFLQLLPDGPARAECSGGVLGRDAEREREGPARHHPYPMGSGAGGGKVEAVAVGAVLHVLRVHASP